MAAPGGYAVTQYYESGVLHCDELASRFYVSGLLYDGKHQTRLATGGWECVTERGPRIGTPAAPSGMSPDPAPLRQGVSSMTSTRQTPRGGSTRPGRSPPDSGAMT